MKKRKYINPKIEEICLDNEISLQLNSPTGTENQHPGFNLSTNQKETYTYENW